MTGTFMNDKYEGVIVKEEKNGDVTIQEMHKGYIFGKGTFYGADGEIRNFI